MIIYVLQGRSTEGKVKKVHEKPNTTALAAKNEKNSEATRAQGTPLQLETAFPRSLSSATPYQQLSLISTVSEHGRNLPGSNSHAEHAPKTLLRSSTALAYKNVSNKVTESSAEQDTFDMTHSAETLLRPPGPNASADERIDFLMQQLDSFGVDKPVVGDLISLGGSITERMQGGVSLMWLISGINCRRPALFTNIATLIILSFCCTNIDHV